jgi:D-glucuronyl C5-epimerase C-terminus
MRNGSKRRAALAVAVVCAVAGGLMQSSAHAATVMVMGPGGKVSMRNDRFLTIPPVTPAPSSTAHAKRFASRHGSRSVESVLSRLRGGHKISAAAYRHYSSTYSSALGSERRLGGTRAYELGSVIANIQQMAAAGALTPARLPAIFLTLQRNRQWWSSGPLPSSGQEIEFTGSQLVWEYYAGQGLELQVLATFGKADGFYTGGPADYPKLKQVLSEMIPLATHRGGGETWEYYFHFDGGVPPWTSAMSQGTGIEALTRAYRAFGARSYLNVAHRALKIFTEAPPVGVAVKSSHGTWYIQYTFAPGAGILNAFLQSLIGLYDYAHASGDQLAQRLFNAGNTEAEAVTPRYDTGAWSLYQPGIEDTLSYHQLVTGFLQELCQRTGAQVYCVTGQHFTQYLHTPPALQQLTQAAPSGRSFTLRFSLSKYSHVGIVITQGGSTAFATSAEFGYGRDGFSVPGLRAGTYSVRLAATDLAGNFKRITGTLKVS